MRSMLGIITPTPFLKSTKLIFVSQFSYIYILMHFYILHCYFTVVILFCFLVLIYANKCFDLMRLKNVRNCYPLL